MDDRPVSLADLSAANRPLLAALRRQRTARRALRDADADVKEHRARVRYLLRLTQRIGAAAEVAVGVNDGDSIRPASPRDDSASACGGDDAGSNPGDVHGRLQRE